MPRYPVILLFASLLVGCGGREALDERLSPASRSATAELSAGETEGYARALEPRPFTFPADHGPHPDFSTEWWYFTGNLESAEGRRFGYQLTFFRRALAPEMPERSSAWASRQVALAHFALTDVEAERFHAFERTSRMAAGLAGARAEPFRVWLEDWSVSAEAGAEYPWRLEAAEDGIAIELELVSSKPPVLQGDRGLSRKGAEPGNASYYFSLTRLESSGVVTLGGERFEVAGTSWLDREWSTSVLEEGQVGWDWFSLQLDDGRELMVYHLRREGGGVDPLSKGSWVEADGRSETLRLEDFELEVHERWRSPRGAEYPSRWLLRVPGKELELEIEPLVADQELDLSFRYWEGAVTARGSAGGEKVTGQGYVELVGYGAAPADSRD